MLTAVSNDSRVGREGLRCVERAVALTLADVRCAVEPGAAAGSLGAASLGLPGSSAANTRVCAAS
jgi:hypothetical protein